MSKKLLEIAIANSLIDNEEFNPLGVFKKNYSFDSNIEDLPLTVEKSTWETIVENDRTYLNKVYKFNTEKHILYFLNEVIYRSNYINHHPKIIIENNLIEIVLYTHDVNDITELDLQMSKYIDEIYNDIVYINRS